MRNWHRKLVGNFFPQKAADVLLTAICFELDSNIHMVYGQVTDLKGESGVAVFTHQRLERRRRNLTKVLDHLKVSQAHAQGCLTKMPDQDSLGRPSQQL
jgi:hypothetical protein